MARKKKNTVVVDFSKVKTGGPMDEGIQTATISDAELKEGEKAQYIRFIMENDTGVAFDNCSLSPNALWRLAKLMRALGFDVPKEELEIDLDAFEGESLRLEIEHEDYEGKPKARVLDYLALGEDDEEEEEDDDAEDEEETDEDEEEEEEEEDDEEDSDSDSDLYDPEDFKALSSKDLDMVIEDEDLSQKLKKIKPIKKKRAAVMEALQKAGLMAE